MDCHVRSVQARCGTLEVFEDRAALGEAAASDPIVVLAGGPGLGAASAVDADVARFFRAMRERRVLIRNVAHD